MLRACVCWLLCAPLLASGTPNQPAAAEPFGRVIYAFTNGLLSGLTIKTGEEFQRLRLRGRQDPFEFRPFKNPTVRRLLEATEVTVHSLSELVHAVLGPLFHLVRAEGRPLQTPPMYRECLKLVCSSVEGEPLFYANPE